MRPIKKHNNSGRLHVYTGDGKGKTTAALGLAMRALGRGWKVLIVKYLKPKRLTSGEDLVIRNISDGIDEMKINCCGVIGRYRKKTEQAVRLECEESLAVIEQQWWKYDLVVLDEINVVLHLGLLDLEKFMFFLSRRPARLELVLTGRYAPKELLRMADYATDVRLVKHPYEKGVKARRGIEF